VRGNTKSELILRHNNCALKFNSKPHKHIFMYKFGICLSLFLSLAFLSCTKTPQELNLDPETEALVNILLDEMEPLDADPLSWSDQDLRWLDPVADKSVIGLGEATHGTAEFFKAKHRIFKYLVENHGYKIFAIEADFGESLFIDEAVQNGNTAAIEDLMNTKMHFWTWKTEEVKDMLEWMCIYNQGKAEEEKVHYMGVDCQFNTYHPDLAMDYLSDKDIPFLAFADSILQVAETATEKKFESYSSESFASYLREVESLQDSMILYKEILVGASSEKEYELNIRIVELVIQVSEVRYYFQNQVSSINYRDKYMAENTSWLLDYYENEEIVLWAHNGHIANFEYGVTGSMGNYLSYELGDQYFTLGFLFSQGTFTAVGMEGETYTGLETQTLDTIPKENSLNAIMSYTGEPAFSIELEALGNYLGWYNAFEKGMEHFQMGSVYNNNPEDYYTTFDPDWFNYMIYFDRSTASDLL
jgi:erythromycin esterase